MKCPVCGDITLSPLELEKDLKGDHCFQCGGVWISSAHYHGWLALHGRDLPESEGHGARLPLSDSTQAKLCPQCGALMALYRVSPNLDFRLDHCGQCGGVWFDHKEWDALKERNLHDNLHEFFSAEYQKKLRRDDERKKQEELYIVSFGREDYESIKKFKEWIDAHPMRGVILAFLTDKDPYDPET